MSKQRLEKTKNALFRELKKKENELSQDEIDEKLDQIGYLNNLIEHLEKLRKLKGE